MSRPVEITLRGLLGAWRRPPAEAVMSKLERNQWQTSLATRSLVVAYRDAREGKGEPVARS
ncbi:MAG: hypothetical protein IPG52_02650 [Rhodocyclaceae bacterium]|nr:hypothetical protein [Rhodocyclaceae bacterium]